MSESKTASQTLREQQTVEEVMIAHRQFMEATQPLVDAISSLVNRSCPGFILKDGALESIGYEPEIQAQIDAYKSQIELMAQFYK